MSRIGKKPIILSDKVTAEISGGLVVVKGPKGELSWKLPQGLEIVKEGQELKVQIDSRGKKEKFSAIWGTARSLIANMVTGVTEGYEKKLEIEGIGFKAQLQGNNIVLSVGFSHPVELKAPEGIAFKVEKNIITVSGADKILVGEVAANIRKTKKPEPYKGKGIHYLGETIRRKSGKKAMAGA
ncbi:MAG: 50S ribosomal protein L6 [Parcubacteria group bacterium]|nr:50S ribosomal protein L6 [Parcubacteria group bacterium]